MKMDGAQQALPVEILPPRSQSSELLRTGRTGKTSGIRKQLRPLGKNKLQWGTLPNTGPGRRDSPYPAAEAQLGAWVHLRLSAQQVGDQTNKHTFQDHSSQKIRIIFWNDLLPLVPGGQSPQRLSEKTVSQVKGPAKMFHLQGPQLLQMLEKSLRKSLPESLKVYGTIFHMNQGNPFNLQALVDKWPDFKTVVIRPREQEMTDDFDHYTNTYQIYSKDLNNCQESLTTSDVINWKQHLQIQSSQFSLNEVIQNLAATKFVKVEHTQCILYVMPETARKLLPSLPETKNLPVGYGPPKAINQEMFKLSSMDPTHAALVNKFWHFGGNERSQRFIERCILAFPTFCLLGPEGTPASWSLMDQTGEIRMGATLPEYRGHGLISHMLAVHTQALDQLGVPVYNHTDKANKIVQRVSRKLHHIAIPHGWNQWNCEPL